MKNLDKLPNELIEKIINYLLKIRNIYEIILKCTFFYNSIIKTSSLSKNSFIISAFLGNYNFIKYAHENGYEWVNNADVMAVFNGNLKCLKYMYENNCEWDSSTTESAAEGVI
jgi:hypothetical protein